MGLKNGACRTDTPKMRYPSYRGRNRKPNPRAGRGPGGGPRRAGPAGSLRGARPGARASACCPSRAP